MPPSKTPQPCDSKLLLQHKRGNSRNWRTAIRVHRAHLTLIQEWVKVAQVLDPSVSWRMVNSLGNPDGTE